MLKKLLLLILLLILVLLILFLLDYCATPEDAPEPAPDPVAENHPPQARNDDLNGCTLTAAGGHTTCTFVAPAGTLFANNGSGADSDPDGDAFTSSSTGTIVVGGTGDPWSPPGPEPRNCNGDFLCTTDRNFVAASSSLSIAPDGGFTMIYVTNAQPLAGGVLIAEFLYELTDAGGAMSDPGYVQVFLPGQG